MAGWTPTVRSCFRPGFGFLWQTGVDVLISVLFGFSWADSISPANDQSMGVDANLEAPLRISIRVGGLMIGRPFPGPHVVTIP